MIFFDLDGTLLDAAQAQVSSWNEAFLRVTGRRVSLDSVDHHGATSRRLVSLLNAPDEPDPTLVLAVLEAHAALLRTETVGGIAPLPGVRETLRSLVERDMPLGVATGNSTAATTALLEASGLLEFFSEIVSGDRTTSRRVLISEARERADGGDPTMIVGDTPHDLRAATENSCIAVGVATGIYGEDELRASGAELVLKDLTHPAAEQLASLYQRERSAMGVTKLESDLT